MPRLKKLACVLCLFWGVHAPVQAQMSEKETRGELLYSTHCNACHTSRIHWRDKKLASGRRSLLISQ